MFYQTIDPQPVKSQLPMIIEINGRTIRLTALVLYSSALESSLFSVSCMGMIHNYQPR